MNLLEVDAAEHPVSELQAPGEQVRSGGEQQATRPGHREPGRDEESARVAAEARLPPSFLPWQRWVLEVYLQAMGRDPKHIERLARELAALTPEERAEVLAKAARNKPLRPLPRDFKPPLLEGGTRWIGGSLRREEIYDDDGR